MVTVIIPAAGGGRRFQEEGYTTPKPFIPINGVPMVYRSISQFPIYWRVVVISQYNFKKYYENSPPRIKKDFVWIDKLTQGPCCTVLEADDIIEADDPVIIADSDQYISLDWNKFLLKVSPYNGAVVTFNSSDPACSYADGYPFVTRTAEKRCISRHAIAGTYYFASWRAFKTAAEAMFRQHDTVNNEYYLSTVYNYLGGFIYNYSIDSKLITRWGTPSDLRAYDHTK